MKFSRNKRIGLGLLGIAGLMLVVGLIGGVVFAQGGFGNDPVLLRYSIRAFETPHAIDVPKSDHSVMAVFSILNFPKNPNYVAPGLQVVARIVDLYRVAGVEKKDLHLVVVFHASGTPGALNNKAYAKHLGTAAIPVKENPNVVLIRELQKDGVKMVVCGQAMHVFHYHRSDILPGITEVYSGLTFIIHKRNEGYAYFPL
jgi:intracellular sulfur oxidation DsrE/DsrF family protein